MNEMVKRVARAIEKAVYETDRGGLTGWDAKAVARASIEAMRVPTEAMRFVGSVAIYNDESAIDVWGLMIDAALEDDHAS